MATATATITIDAFPAGIDNSQRVIYVSGTIAVSASPATYATGGLALNWAGLQAGGNYLFVESQGSNLNPFMVWLTSAAVSGTTVGGYGYVWNKANNTFQILATTGALGTAGVSPTQEEMANGTAIPAAISNDTIRFEAIFIRNLG
jgi:hypothetical protein